MTYPGMCTLLMALCLGLVLGAGLSALWPQAPSSAPVSVTCRPSHPPQALAQATEPVVLFWGNSLLFDHSWDDNAFVAVNCARQGMTLTAALPATAALPQMEIDAILLGFGSVELIRPGPVDTDRWAQDMAELLDALRTRYPRARILAATIPAGARAQVPWQYGQRPELPRMNAALEALLGPDTLDLSTLLDDAQMTHQHYDGVHLSRDSYRLWQNQLVTQLGLRTGSR